MLLVYDLLTWADARCTCSCCTLHLWQVEGLRCYVALLQALDFLLAARSLHAKPSNLAYTYGKA